MHIFYESALLTSQCGDTHNLMETDQSHITANNSSATPIRYVNQLNHHQCIDEQNRNPIIDPR